MKCRRCREPAVIDVRRHNAGFCASCFERHCGEQVRRAIEDHDMIEPGQRGARGWLIVASIAGGLRLLRYVTREHEEILFRTLVAPGDQFEITTKTPRKR